MTEQSAPSFAALLQQLRGAVKLTQEELAEEAGLSVRAVSDLERGIHQTARKDTALMLAMALGLTEPVAVVFVKAARGRAAPEDVLAALQRPGKRDGATGLEYPGPQSGVHRTRRSADRGAGAPGGRTGGSGAGAPRDGRGR